MAAETGKWCRTGYFSFGILAIAITSCMASTTSSTETSVTSTEATTPPSVPEVNNNTRYNCSAFCQCPTVNTSSTTDIPVTTPLPRLCNSTDDCDFVENTTVECRNGTDNCSQMVNNVTEVCNTTTGLCQNVTENRIVNCTNENDCPPTSNNAILSCNSTFGACQNESELNESPRKVRKVCDINTHSSGENGIALCNTSNGHCLYGCQPGYARPTCNIKCSENCSECVLSEESNDPICTLCKYNFYKRGNECVPCPNNCLEEAGSEPTCRREDGECVYGCQDGYYGSLCELDCSHFCFQYKCNRHDGCCSIGCIQPEYCGCYCTSKCGPACRNQQCRLNCSCLEGCIAGFYGISCGYRCGDNCVKSDVEDVSACDQANGNCLKGCIENEWWGDRCEKSCSSGCKNGTCIMENGTCTDGCTSANWSNHDCSERCHVNCVDELCLQSTGECSQGCVPGWFGPICSEECNKNCLNNTCERDSGTCINGCGNGYYGNSCSQECNEHCKKRTCEFVGGNCTNGCDEGWIPPRCEDQTTPTTVPPPSTLGINIGIGIGSVVVLCVTLAVVCRNRRRRSKMRRGIRNVVDRATKIFSGVFSRKPEHGSEISPYGQIPINIVPSSRIPVADIFDVVMKITLDELIDEFDRLPAGFTKEFGTAREAQNLTKNFYDVYPYDENRVVLQPTNEGGSDYINASHINGYKSRYIAAQGPLKTTFSDFWTMVWQQDVSIIVMLIAPDNELENYWPDKEAEVTHGDITINETASESFADFVIRDFKLNSNGEEKMVQQLHFSGWPESKRGVPPSAAEMIEFFHKYRAVLKTKEPAGPVLVHCNAGIGRTGVFMALDIATDDVLDTGSLDIFDTVRELRNQRPDMVQKRAQYQFLYEAAAQIMAFGCDLVPRKRQGVAFESLSKTLIKNGSQLKKLYKTCNSSLALDEQDIACISTKQELRRQDRPTSDIPEIRYMPELLDETYINAVNIDTYKKTDAIVATQMPSPETMEEFIQLVLQRECGVILMLNIPDKDDGSISFYWNKTSTYGKVKVSHGKVKKFQNYKTRNLILEDKGNTDQKGKPTRHEVQLIQYQDWDDRAETETLPTAQSVVNLVKTVRQALNQVPEKRLLVHCLNGSDQTGLFCVVYNLLEKADLEEFINVVCTIRKVKTRRPSALPTYNQFKLCCEVFILYLAQMDLLTYANINSEDNTGYDDSDDEKPSASGSRDSDDITENPSYDPYEMHKDEKSTLPATYVIPVIEGDYADPKFL